MSAFGGKADIGHPLTTLIRTATMPVSRASGETMRRREFITLVGGVVAWPVAAHAQQGERVRRIGVLAGGQDTDDPRSQPNVTAFLQALQQLGWADGRNVKIEYRWPTADVDKTRKYAAELAALAPDVILAISSPSLASLLQATRTVPIVFVGVADPVGAGFVESLSRPSGNATGFINFEYSIGSKWLELLKEIAPGVKRAAVLRDPAITTGIGQWGAIQSAAPALGLEVSPISTQGAGEIERGIAAFARSDSGGLIVAASPTALVYSDLIIALADRYKLPSVFFMRPFVTGGGLVSYGPDVADQARRAASYVDRILKGEKPADLPVQAPTKYELVINLKTAKALGLTIPPAVLARADEVIE
jgi:putative tryptophan/tyrosine transport system substrate-binding protein